MALLEVEDLSVRFHTRAGIVRAVDGVSFTVNEGETVGLVGESGSGKSVTSLALMGMVAGRRTQVSARRLALSGVELLGLSAGDLRRRRGRDLAMIFQNPTSSLNPIVRISTQITEALVAHERLSRGRAHQRARELLSSVGISDVDRVLNSYPHRLSGGMCQRVMIAIALSLRPRLLIADEPTTALDVTIQAQVLELMRELTREAGTAVILITHDLGVVAAMAQRVNVMYAGRVVEAAATPNLFSRPRHPYTVGLLRSIVRSDRDSGTIVPIPGQPPDPGVVSPGCAFVPRCAWRTERCVSVVPVFDRGPALGLDGGFACHNPVAVGELALRQPASSAVVAEAGT